MDKTVGIVVGLLATAAWAALGMEPRLGIIQVFTFWVPIALGYWAFQKMRNWRLLREWRKEDAQHSAFTL
jgi:hypothetical protein